jgi:hypothetical protein
VKEILILPEMLAAGMEAKRAAEMDCLAEGEVVLEVYLAMYGMAIKAYAEAPETVQ